MFFNIIIREKIMKSFFKTLTIISLFGLSFFSLAKNSDMNNTVLHGENLTDANLAQANLTQANLAEAKKNLCKSAEYNFTPFCID
uniref:Pentapeptide repeat-containing protein n=2 Tax=Arsenophonus nasoniae TaxID=638 RepID=D2TWL2_9GAMM|nr:hypothetical protein ARN_04460 [Arsenophonus nasoniae]